MPKFFQRETPLLEAPDLLESPQQTGSNNPDPSDNLLKTLLVWKAPSRPFRKKDRSFYTTVVILLVLVGLIAALAQEFLLIGVLFAFGFVVYVLNFVPPEEVECKLTTQGVTVGDHFYHWQELDSFWMDKKEGHRVLYILTNLRFPGVLMLITDPVEEENIKRLCARFLPFHEIPPKTWMDKASDYLQKHFQLELTHK